MKIVGMMNIKDTLRHRRDIGSVSHSARGRLRRTGWLVEQHVSRAVDRRGQKSGFAPAGLDPLDDTLMCFVDVHRRGIRRKL